MKKIKIITICVAVAGILASCGSKRDPGLTYMPDMQYSRAYEAFAENDLAAQDVHYVPYPVEGTVRRGDLFPYTLPNDSAGYAMSASVKNPLPPITKEQVEEAGRLYNINCGICHGAKLDAQGPLATGGKVPAVANLTTATYLAMPEGTMFHAITYGKGNMGSYASQLTREQRWRVVQYVKYIQNGGKIVEPAEQDTSLTQPGAEPIAQPNTGQLNNADSTQQ